MAEDLRPRSGSLLGGGDSNDGLKTVFDGFITDVDVQLGSDPDDAFINLSGMDASVLMSVEEKVATWPDMADSDIVQQIVASLWCCRFRLIPPRRSTRRPTRPLCSAATDIQFIQDLAQKQWNGILS